MINVRKILAKVLGIDLETNKTKMASECSETAVKKGSTKHCCRETARMTQDIQTSCHQEDISSDFQS